MGELGHMVAVATHWCHSFAVLRRQPFLLLTNIADDRGSETESGDKRCRNGKLTKPNHGPIIIVGCVYSKMSGWELGQSRSKIWSGPDQKSLNTRGNP